MKKIFVDTDVLINFSKGYDSDLEGYLEEQNNGRCELYVNPVVVAEFFTDKNLTNPKKYQKAQEFFYFFKTVNIDKKIALLTGRLLREEKTHTLGDSFIAATCLINNFYLLTKNKKDFEAIKGLRLI